MVDVLNDWERMKWWEDVVGSELEASDGSFVQAEEVLYNKVVVLYFSAKWCPPCKVLTPLLRNLYLDEVKKVKLPVEVIFVSSDTDKEEMRNYFKEEQPDWYAVPFDAEGADELLKRFEIDSVPALVVMGRDGKIVTSDGKREIVKKQGKVFAEWVAADGHSR